MTEPGVIHVERHIPHPPSAVWKALTSPALMARWWAAGDIRPEVGHRFTLDMGGWGQQECEVLEVEPEHLLSYSFAPDTLETTITWRLRPDGQGTSVTFEHSGFDLDSPLGGRAYQGMGAGWPNVLGRIESVLSDPTEQPG
jgi:uncharacterized protein YndB with AHSA1/START domain